MASVTIIGFPRSDQLHAIGMTIRAHANVKYRRLHLAAFRAIRWASIQCEPSRESPLLIEGLPSWRHSPEREELSIGLRSHASTSANERTSLALPRHIIPTMELIAPCK